VTAQTRASRPSEYIDGLVCGLPEPFRSKRQLVMLRFYGDDSDVDQPPMHVLAGWVADSSVWKPFADEWRAVCEMRPRISYFKFNEAMGLNGEFNGFTKQSRDEKLALFVNLCAEYKLLPAYSLLPAAIYNSCFAKPIYGEKIDRYFLLLYSLVSRVSEHLVSQGVRERVYFNFDVQPGKEEAIRRAWDLFLERLPNDEERTLVGNHPPWFHDDKLVTPLQAADLLAGWCRIRDTASIRGEKMHSYEWAKRFEKIEALAFAWSQPAIEQLYAELVGHRPITYYFDYGGKSWIDAVR